MRYPNVCSTDLLSLREIISIKPVLDLEKMISTNLVLDRLLSLLCLGESHDMISPKVALYLKHILRGFEKVGELYDPSYRRNKLF